MAHPAHNPTARPDYVLRNANVITLDARFPRASAVAVRDGAIAWVGRDDELARSGWQGVRVLDCDGRTLVPGFVDSHLHLMAYAASLRDVDCGPDAVRSISDVRRAIADRARDVPAGSWIVARGYDESALLERRHPTRRDLDAATRLPVRLVHRTGHACVLNSAALAQVGIDAATPDPVEGVIVRDASGEPTGLLLEMDAYLDGRTPRRSTSEFDAGMSQAGERLAALGVTSVVDATPSNSVERWETFKRLGGAGAPLPRITMMAGYDHLDRFVAEGMGYGHGDDLLRLGAVKIVLTATTGALHPQPEELAQMVARAHAAGFPVAIHAVEAEAVEAAARAIAASRRLRPIPFADRIEHCSECPPGVLRQVRRAGVAVSTQPAFLHHRGDKYLAEVASEIQPWLYAMRSLLDAGVPTAAGSDAPVVDPNPMVGVGAAVTRASRDGRLVAPGQAVTPIEALSAYTLWAARASGLGRVTGSIEVGKLADFALLNADPTAVAPEDIRRIRGRVVPQTCRGDWLGPGLSPSP